MRGIMDLFTCAVVLILITQGMNAQLLEPENATVLINSNVRFNCSITGPGWIVMTFSVNGILAVSILENSGPVSVPSSYSVTNHSTTGEDKWEFLIKAVTAANAGEIRCQVQNRQPVVVTLTVQQNGTVEIEGSNRTATEGDDVTFQCLAAGWSPAAELSWTTNGNPVDKTLYDTSSIQNGNLMNSTSNVTITAKENVSVECLASISTLQSPQISTVFLTVRPRDQTVLIAITVAFSLAALLALIIIGIIFCWKRRKRRRSRYEEEVRARSLARRQQAAQNQRVGVREPIGYAEERPRADNRDGVYTISNNRPRNYIDIIQTPQENSSGYDSPAYNGYSPDDLRQKHRHLTIV